MNGHHSFFMTKRLTSDVLPEKGQTIKRRLYLKTKSPENIPGLFVFISILQLYQSADGRKHSLHLQLFR